MIYHLRHEVIKYRSLYVIFVIGVWPEATQGVDCSITLFQVSSGFLMHFRVL